MLQAQPSTGLGALSPLVASYEGWASGNPHVEPLPRPVLDFLAQFGPQVPILPSAINEGDEDTGRPMPRRSQYPIAWNLPIGQPGAEGLKLTSFAQLRALADTYSVANACLRVRKEEILGLSWDIRPTDEAGKAMKGNDAEMEAFQERRAEALRFWKRPDPNFPGFHGWLSALLEEIFVVDALTVYLHPPRKPGAGPFGSDLASLDLLDGTTIRPLLDVNGARPRPPRPAFQQYLYGVARSDMMDVILGTDMEDMSTDPDLDPAAIGEYRADQLLYLPYTTRSWTPYGFPPIERALLPVALGLRRQNWQLEFFTEGSIPGMFIIPGEDVATPQQQMQLQNTLNALAGDSAWKHRIIVLPPGSKTDPWRHINLADSFDELQMNQVCMAFDVMPFELGILPKISNSGPSAGASNQMAKATQKINERKALRPLLAWLTTQVFNFVLHEVWEQRDMEWVWTDLEQDEDELGLANKLSTEVFGGLRSIDEARGEIGLPPWGLPQTSEPMIAGQSFPTMVSAMPMEPAPVAPAGAPPGAASGDDTPDNVTGGPDGGKPAKKPGGGSESPLNTATDNAQDSKPDAAGAGKSVFNELQALRRHLKKGRPLDRWVPSTIPADVWAQMQQHEDPIELARVLLDRPEPAEGKLALVGGLGALAKKLARGEITADQFVAMGEALVEQAT